MIQILILGTVISIASVGILTSITQLQKSSLRSDQKMEVDLLEAEISDLLSDPTTCVGALEESTLTLPKFCQNFPHPVRVKKDLGAQGPSPEDEILVGLPGDNVSTKAGVTFLAEITSCTTVTSTTSKADLLLKGKRADGFEFSRPIQVTINYAPLDPSTVVGCSIEKPSTNPAQDICLSLQGGVWNPLAAPPCVLPKVSAAHLLMDETGVIQNLKNKVNNSSIAMMNVTTNLYPHSPMAFLKSNCRYRLSVSSNNTTATTYTEEHYNFENKAHNEWAYLPNGQSQPRSLQIQFSLESYFGGNIGAFFCGTTGYDIKDSTGQVVGGTIPKMIKVSLFGTAISPNPLIENLDSTGNVAAFQTCISTEFGANIKYQVEALCP